MKYVLGACLVFSLGWNCLQFWAFQLVNDRYKQSTTSHIELIREYTNLKNENSRMKHELLNDTDALQELLRRLDERDKREGVIQPGREMIVL